MAHLLKASISCCPPGRLLRLPVVRRVELRTTSHSHTIRRVHDLGSATAASEPYLQTVCLASFGRGSIGKVEPEVFLWAPLNFLGARHGGYASSVGGHARCATWLLARRFLDVLGHPRRPVPPKDSKVNRTPSARPRGLARVPVTLPRPSYP